LHEQSLRVGLVLLLLSILAYSSLNTKAASAVVEWDNLGYPQTLVPPNLSNVIAVAGGTWNSMALKDDGTVVFWGYDYYHISSMYFPPGLTNISAIALGYAHALALRKDGHVLAWGAGML